MSITFSGISDEHGSPFLEMHERIAAEWTAFAAKNDAEVHGNYNALRFEAKVKVISPNGSWSIKGHRYQSTVAGGIPLDSPVHEATEFLARLGTPLHVQFSIRRNGLNSLLGRMLGKPIHPSGISAELMVRTNSLEQYRRVLSGNEEFMSGLQIKALEFNSSGKVTVRTNSLIKTKVQLARTLDLLVRISQAH